VNNAVRRAQSLRKKHHEESTDFPDDNPSSSFDQLITRIREVAKSNK
jgi:hypothetical protein